MPLQVMTRNLDFLIKQVERKTRLYFEKDAFLLLTVPVASPGILITVRIAHRQNNKLVLIHQWCNLGQLL